MIDARGPRGNKSCRHQRKLLGCLVIAALLAASLGAMETLSQRRRQVEEMSAEQLDELFRSEQQFHDLSPQDKQRIRDLHDQIELAPDRDKLRATMNRYCKWFETQPPFRRAKLLDKKQTTKDRIAIVKEFLKRPAGPTKDIHLGDKNRRVLAAWLDRYTAEHGPGLIVSMTQSHPGIAKLPPDRQQAVLREMLLRRWQSADPNGQMPIAGPERDRLLAALTSELRAKLEVEKPGEQARIIGGWLRETASHELDEQLVDFFENSINDEERDRLMSLPSDEMYKSLSDQYSAHLKQSKSAESPRGDRPSPKRGRRSGGLPWGSGGRHWPENRDDKNPRAGKDFKDNPLPAAAKSTAEKRPAEKETSEKPVAQKPSQERRITEH
ncbi:MAG: hypothetical protein ACLP9L_23730 [Thermoguttaceae bacterium]